MDKTELKEILNQLPGNRFEQICLLGKLIDRSPHTIRGYISGWPIPNHTAEFIKAQTGKLASE